MIAPSSPEEDAAGRTEQVAAGIRTIRSKYAQSGLYPNDGSTTPIWTVDWYAGVELLSDGVHLVRGGSLWAGPSEKEAVAFFASGKLLRSFTIGELYSPLISSSDSRITWLYDSHLNYEKKTYTMKTKHLVRYTFDVTTGQLMSSVSVSPVPWILTIVIVLIAGNLGYWWKRSLPIPPRPRLRAADYAFSFGSVSLISLLTACAVMSDPVSRPYKDDLAILLVVLSLVSGLSAIVVGSLANTKAKEASDARGKAVTRVAVVLGVVGSIGLLVFCPLSGLISSLNGPPAADETFTKITKLELPPEHLQVMVQQKDRQSCSAFCAVFDIPSQTAERWAASSPPLGVSDWSHGSLDPSILGYFQAFRAFASLSGIFDVVLSTRFTGKTVYVHRWRGDPQRAGDLLVVDPVVSRVYLVSWNLGRPNMPDELFRWMSGFDWPADAQWVLYSGFDGSFPGDGEAYLVFDVDRASMMEWIASPAPWGEWRKGAIDYSEVAGCCLFGTGGRANEEGDGSGAEARQHLQTASNLYYSVNLRGPEEAKSYNGDILVLDPKLLRVWISSWDY
jgi:hypothetical protein